MFLTPIHIIQSIHSNITTIKKAIIDMFNYLNRDTLILRSILEETLIANHLHHLTLIIDLFNSLSFIIFNLDVMRNQSHIQMSDYIKIEKKKDLQQLVTLSEMF
jgi:hypothetical protein